MGTHTQSLRATKRGESDWYSQSLCIDTVAPVVWARETVPALHCTAESMEGRSQCLAQLYTLRFSTTVGEGGVRGEREDGRGEGER